MSSTGITGGEGLEGMIGALVALENVPWAEAALPAVDAHLRGAARAGRTPEGEPWPLTVEGTVALRGAADALQVRAAGASRLVARIDGRYAFHHFGAQFKPVRRQLPAGAMPAELGNAIRAGLAAPFHAITKAGKRGYRYAVKKGWNIKPGQGARR